MKKTTIILSAFVAVVVAAGLGVLIWWLVAGRYSDDFTTIVLEGEGLGVVQHTAAITRIRDSGDLFWWFYPTATGITRPIILWLDGVTGLPPSLLANFAMFGPLDFNLNRRNDSWVDEFNLLFVDAPLGTGFSTASSASSIPRDINENTDHLLFVLESFYSVHQEYQDAPLYIFGQGDGASLALSLTNRLAQQVPFTHNLQGIALGNGVVSPALALTRLGFYLDEMGYVDPTGRAIIEDFTSELSTLVSQNRLEEAFDQFLRLGQFINDEAGCVAVNLGHILQKLTQDTETRDYFGQKHYLRSALQLDVDFNQFMVQTVAPALGISATSYDEGREDVLQAFRTTYMAPVTNLVENILQNTNLTVAIYNGNLDAVSTTPGQLEWVNSLQWSGQEQFINALRRPFIVNQLIEGYFRQTERLTFYSMKTAGVSVPLDSPAPMRRVVQLITNRN